MRVTVNNTAKLVTSPAVAGLLDRFKKYMKMGAAADNKLRQPDTECITKMQKMLYAAICANLEITEMSKGRS